MNHTRRYTNVLLFLLLISFIIISCKLVEWDNSTRLPPSPEIRLQEVTSLPTVTRISPTRNNSEYPTQLFTSTPADLHTRKLSLLTPPTGYLYHGVFPGGMSGEEDDLVLENLHAYEESAGKNTAWVYFSHNWYKGHDFTLRTATWIRSAGSIPFIRLMLRSNPEQNHSDPAYSPVRIVKGDFDADFRAWARAAREFQTPIIVEYGTEVNGEWFPWNGKWYGDENTHEYGDPTLPDGAEIFRDAYRRIIQISREEGAQNITWVFHINHADIPQEEWNRMELYYPGNEWIDWIGVSVYGAQTPLDEEWVSYRQSMDAVYPRLEMLFPEKPIILLEFGVTSGNPLGDQAEWAEEALNDITSFRWKRLIGFSWWNEKWQNDDNPAHDTNMQVQDNPDLEAVFHIFVGNNSKILGRIILNPQP